jgi:hypothetical protein
MKALTFVTEPVKEAIGQQFTEASPSRMGS